jgi:hypothetical protein
MAHTSDDVSLDSSGDEDDSMTWKKTAIDLKKENVNLKNVVDNLECKVSSLLADAETVRMDVITRAHRMVDCDQELYKRIGDSPSKFFSDTSSSSPAMTFSTIFWRVGRRWQISQWTTSVSMSGIVSRGGEPVATR